MRLTKCFLLFLCSLPTYANPVPLNILTYNIWGVPFAGKRAIQRIPLISSKIKTKEFDLVGIQESFKGCFRRDESHLFLTYSNFPYYAEGPKEKGIKCLNSGLLLLSKYPVLKTKKLVYENCSGLDCFSRKGALYARIQLPDENEIDVYLTHTNSGASSKNASSRLKQMKQLVQFVKKYSGDQKRPVLLMGDFNAASTTTEIEFLKSELSLIDSHERYVDTSPTTPEERDGYSIDPKKNGNITDSAQPMRIDYVFYREPKSNKTTINVHRSSLMFKSPTYRNLPLSDHFGVKAELILNN